MFDLRLSFSVSSMAKFRQLAFVSGAAYTPPANGGVPEFWSLLGLMFADVSMKSIRVTPC